MTTLSPQVPGLTHEFELLSAGHECVAGVDEAGRGALAGPVVAAAVILPLDRFDLAHALEGVRDSKQVPPHERTALAGAVREVARTVGIGLASAKEVDDLGLLPATRLAMRRALDMLDPPPSVLLIDHLQLPDVDLPQEAITRGDQSVLSIAAASIVAKVWRDDHMRALGERFAEYGFERHKGYGTYEHRTALQRLGPCREHRRSYAPVRRALSTAPAG